MLLESHIHVLKFVVFYHYVAFYLHTVHLYGEVLIIFDEYKQNTSLIHWSYQLVSPAYM